MFQENIAIAWDQRVKISVQRVNSTKTKREREKNGENSCMKIRNGSGDRETVGDPWRLNSIRARRRAFSAALRYVDCEQRCDRCPGRIAAPRRPQLCAAPPRAGIMPRRWATSVKRCSRERAALARADNRRTRGKITVPGPPPIPQSSAGPIVTSAFAYRYWFIPQRTHRGRRENRGCCKINLSPDTSMHDIQRTRVCGYTPKNRNHNVECALESRIRAKPERKVFVSMYHDFTGKYLPEISKTEEYRSWSPDFWPVWEMRFFRSLSEFNETIVFYLSRSVLVLLETKLQGFLENSLNRVS